jgi:hypothetical protein
MRNQNKSTTVQFVMMGSGVRIPLAAPVKPLTKMIYMSTIDWSAGRNLIRGRAGDAFCLECTEVDPLKGASKPMPVDYYLAIKTLSPLRGTELVEIRTIVDAATSVANADVSALIPHQFKRLLDGCLGRVPFEGQCPS